jgi:conjugative relaxase-like TrwC/TraI family protein
VQGGRLGACGAVPGRCHLSGVPGVLSVIKLADAEYTIGQVALGIEEYYLGEGEAPGGWAGRRASTLGLEGVVAADDLRAMVNGVDPGDGTWWLEGGPAQKVKAFDATFSAPKSASVLWAFGAPEVASIVSRAHVQAMSGALAFLEDAAAVSRQQTGGVRTRVGT